MKNISSSNKNIKNTLLNEKSTSKKNYKSTNINILLNRVKLNKQSEKLKKFYFSVVTSLGLILFGLVVFY